MCWFRVSVKKLVPLMFLQSQSAGRSPTTSFSCARGPFTFSLRSAGELFHLVGADAASVERAIVL
jgi:hypothetical protein